MSYEDRPVVCSYPDLRSLLSMVWQLDQNAGSWELSSWSIGLKNEDPYLLYVFRVPSTPPLRLSSGNNQDWVWTVEGLSITFERIKGQAHE
jgi:hypothetical protein